ncbi:MAG: hypothetical protein HGA80_08205 [Candidatus Omnitrophica bacterium]|nr:hypothetical protein [Candidatus Omnitrophota bacterium]
MKNKLAFISILVGVCLFAVTVHASSDWRRVNNYFGNTEMRGAKPDPIDGRKLMVMTASGLYRVDRALSATRASNIISEPVNDVFVLGEQLLVATDKGLFASRNGGRMWKQELTNVLAVDVTAGEGKFFLATSSGVYLREFNESVWARMTGILGRANARRILATDNGVFVLTDHELYFMADDMAQARKVFSYGALAEEGEAVEAVKDEEGSESSQSGLVDIFEGYEGIYLAARDGLFVSRDGGVTWQAFQLSGEVSGDISSVVSMIGEGGRELVCLGTSKGVACGREGSLEMLYSGMEDVAVRRLAVLREHGLVATTRSGIYILENVAGRAAPLADADAQCVFKDYASIVEEFVHEPTVRDVQSWAVDYAEANKAKIDAWRRQARGKAFLPAVSVGVDRASGELLHWDTGPNPDVLQKGRAYADWDLRLTWELSDLIWSSDQTSIDSRSKMMVELREQVIDQVTRIYFERRRLQVEITSCAYANTGDRMAAEMRVDELTALLDGYTGGVFSKRTNINSFNHQPRRNNV